MKRLQWSLAAVAVALCVGLAVWTVAIRSGNLHMRRSQHWLQLRGIAAQVETQRVGLQIHLQQDANALAQRFRAVQGQAGAGLPKPGPAATGPGPIHGLRQSYQGEPAASGPGAEGYRP